MAARGRLSTAVAANVVSPPARMASRLSRGGPVAVSPPAASARRLDHYNEVASMQGTGRLGATPRRPRTVTGRHSPGAGASALGEEAAPIGGRGRREVTPP